VDSAFKFSWFGLMYLNCRAGLAIEEDWVKELTRRLHDAPFGPGDGTAMYMLKELTISGDICLSKSEIEQLFSAALTNPTIAPHIRGDAYSWLADYYVLRARDLQAARLTLERARAITPYNPGILLQLAQLAYLEGQHDEAKNLLDAVQKLPLRHSDKELLSTLHFCLSDSRAEKACKGR
jgi:tetratricopeptide (TPR) repeat protein